MPCEHADPNEWAISIEQLFQKGFALLGISLVSAIAAILTVGIAMLWLIGRSLLNGRLLNRSRWRHVLIGALNDLVELATIKPDATALRAIINLDALTLAHHERNFADRARHGMG